MNNLTVISFYTDDWEYPTHAIRLKEECERLSLNYKIENLSSTKDYLSNTRLKPKFIKDKLLELKSPVLWIDVDGSILKSPDHLIQNIVNTDFAGCKMETSNLLGRIWHVGTLFFNYTPASLKFLDFWIAHLNNGSDEAAFNEAWKNFSENINVLILDKEQYHKIIKWKVHPTENTVICHRLSASDSKKEMKNRKLNIK